MSAKRWYTISITTLVRRSANNTSISNRSTSAMCAIRETWTTCLSSICRYSIRYSFSRYTTDRNQIIFIFIIFFGTTLRLSNTWIIDSKCIIWTCTRRPTNRWSICPTSYKTSLTSTLFIYIFRNNSTCIQ